VRCDPRPLLLAGVALAAGTGCAAGFSVGLGPRIDTEGRPGLEIVARGDFGMGVELQAIVAEAGATGGVDFSPAAPLLGTDAGFAYQQELVSHAVALRGGVRGRFQWRDDDNWRNALGVGGAFAVLPTLRETETWTEHLGAELSGTWLSVEPPRGRDGRGNVGLFSLLLVYSRLIAVAGPQLDLVRELRER
jgi:hypothetical protein